jgi:hypothetical protein
MDRYIIFIITALAILFTGCRSRTVRRADERIE